MKKEQAFEALDCFKKQALSISHVYDVYHGEKEVIVHQIIYESNDPTAKFIASIYFEDIFSDEEYIVDITIGQKTYQLFDFDTCVYLIRSIKY